MTAGHYPVTGDASSHGLVGFANLRDGSIAITTSIGYLYLLRPGKGGGSEVISLGWFHPGGKSFSSSLVSLDGDRFLAGVAKRKGGPHECVIYNLQTRSSQKAQFKMNDVPEHGMKGMALYGSNTRDDLGRFSLVGGYKTADGSRHLPLCLRVGISFHGGDNLDGI